MWYQNLFSLLSLAIMNSFFCFLISRICQRQAILGPYSLCLSLHFQPNIMCPGNPYWGGKISTIDLLVLTSLDKLLFPLKILFMVLTKQATLMRRSSDVSLPLQLEFLVLSQWWSTLLCASAWVDARYLYYKTFYDRNHPYPNKLECLQLSVTSKLV
jgi:hypothetical protein